MQIVEKYDPTHTYMYPSGAIATPERVKQDYPAVELFQHVVITDEARQIMWSIQNLSSLASSYGVSGTDEEKIAAIQEKINQPAPTPAPSAEERIAAALEFQNLQML